MDVLTGMTGGSETVPAPRVGRFACRTYVVPVAGMPLRLLGPRSPDDLLDDPDVAARFARDEYLPYWAVPWAAAVMLAEHVAARRRPSARPVLEIGCGLGLTAVAMARGGHCVIATDYDADALAFTRENARLNGVVLEEVRHFDWREPPDVRFETIIGADVLYEARLLEPVVMLLARCLAADGRAYICDPARRAADGFTESLTVAGLSVEVTGVEARDVTAEAPCPPTVRGWIFEVWRHR
jgi:predicted nicotinamide N-methyase